MCVVLLLAIGGFFALGLLTVAAAMGSARVTREEEARSRVRATTAIGPHRHASGRGAVGRLRGGQGACLNLPLLGYSGKEVKHEPAFPAGSTSRGGTGKPLPG